jgi:cystathionine beta-lyase
VSTSTFDFDQPVERRGTDSVKHDGCKAYFGSEDVLPMWVADMDFAVPSAVSRALQERAAHPVFGYTLYPEAAYDALIGWLRRRHGWEIQKEWVVFTPGVVPALHAAVMAYTGPGEGVIVQSPVYYPFYSSVTQTGRRLLINPLTLEEGRYRMDLEHFAQCAADGAKMLLLCSPHNPVGRVWEPGELADLMEICRQHDITVLSDEIHHDLIYPGIRHHPLAKLGQNAEDIVTAVAPSKTFNIPGLGLSAMIVADAKRRSRLRKAMDSVHMTASNPFGITAFVAAYAHGDEWLEALLAYLDESRREAGDFIRDQLPGISLIEPEGTYLLWLDCRELGMPDEELKRFFIHQARVGCNPGVVFGETGSGFMRLNIGTTRAKVTEALSRIASAVAGR